MGIKYSKEQRERIIQMSKGKVVEKLDYSEAEEYWTYTFTDGTDVSFRFMAELS